MNYILTHWSWFSFVIGIVAAILWFFAGTVGWWFFIIRKRGSLWREVTQADFERVKRSIKSGTN